MCRAAKGRHKVQPESQAAFALPIASDRSWAQSLSWLLVDVAAYSEQLLPNMTWLLQ